LKQRKRKRKVASSEEQKEGNAGGVKKRSKLCHGQIRKGKKKTKEASGGEKREKGPE